MKYYFNDWYTQIVQAEMWDGTKEHADKLGLTYKTWTRPAFVHDYDGELVFKDVEQSGYYYGECVVYPGQYILTYSNGMRSVESKQSFEAKFTEMNTDVDWYRLMSYPDQVIALCEKFINSGDPDKIFAANLIRVYNEALSECYVEVCGAINDPKLGKTYTMNEVVDRILYWISLAQDKLIAPSEHDENDSISPEYGEKIKSKLKELYDKQI